MIALVLALIMAIAPTAFAADTEKVLNIATFSGAGDLDPAGIAIDMWTEYCKLCVDPLIRFDEAAEKIKLRGGVKCVHISSFCKNCHHFVQTFLKDKKKLMYSIEY